MGRTLLVAITMLDGIGGAAAERLPTKVEARAVAEGVLNKLREPSSAKFGKVFVGDAQNGVAPVCGYVNAKNGFGGYTGMAPFYGSMAINDAGKMVFILHGLGESNYPSVVIYTTCKQKGISL